MGDYFVSAVISAALLSLLTFLSYRAGSEREVKFASFILLIYTLTSPLVSLLSQLPDIWQIPEFDIESFEPSAGEYIEVSEQAFCDGIERLIMSEYGAPDECVAVTVRGFDFSKMRAERVNIYLSGKGVLLDWRGIEEYINGLSLGECEVFIDIG